MFAWKIVWELEKRQTRHGFGNTVLILVCVEDSVGDNSKTFYYDKQGVLILVCVEDSVGVGVLFCIWCAVCVLILVCVEDSVGGHGRANIELAFES